MCLNAIGGGLKSYVAFTVIGTETELDPPQSSVVVRLKTQNSAGISDEHDLGTHIAKT